jgi:hypothetical protein
MSQNGGHFDADWLSLREPADAAARSKALVNRLDAWLADRKSVHIVDLGAGHGSNLRFLGPRLHGHQEWLLIDHDPELLKHACRHLTVRSTDGHPIPVQGRSGNLNELAGMTLTRPDVLTTSALLDLCSRQWIKTLVEHMASWRCAGLFSLNVNGRRFFIDQDGQEIVNHDDAQMAAWFNEHQRQAKGLGPALGPDSVTVLAAELERVGFLVFQESTPWHCPAGDADTSTLVRALVDGWRLAALEIAPEHGEFIDRWHRERMEWLNRNQAGLVIGHIDLLTVPEFP